MRIQRAYRYRFYPMDEQIQQLEHTFGCCRFVYNYFLNAKQKSWTEEKKALSFLQCALKLTHLKDELIWLKGVSSVTLQQSLRHLEKAFGNFFAKRAKFPKFKKKFWDQSAVFTKNAFVFRDGKITLAKQKEPLNIKWSRHFTGEPSSLTITKERSGRYYISILVEEEISPLPFVRKEIGIDLGLSHTISDHEGNKENPSHFLKNTLKQLKRKQQSLARKRVGSANWKKAKKVVGTLFAKIRDRRVDFLHQLSWRLVNENQVIAAETLNVKGMMKNRCLAQRIGDAGWGTLLRFLDYKSAWYGRMFVQIDQFFPSSKECSHCGALHKELRLEERTWQCLQCQTLHDRDVNAARNILKEGLKKLGVPWGTRDLKPAEFV